MFKRNKETETQLNMQIRKSSTNGLLRLVAVDRAATQYETFKRNACEALKRALYDNDSGGVDSDVGDGGGEKFFKSSQSVTHTHLNVKCSV